MMFLIMGILVVVSLSFYADDFAEVLDGLEREHQRPK
jgi:hypothetical protein